jgi:hypothetical protein
MRVNQISSKMAAVLNNPPKTPSHTCETPSSQLVTRCPPGHSHSAKLKAWPKHTEKQKAMLSTPNKWKQELTAKSPNPMNWWIGKLPRHFRKPWKIRITKRRTGVKNTQKCNLHYIINCSVLLDTQMNLWIRTHVTSRYVKGALNLESQYHCQND